MKSLRLAQRDATASYARALAALGLEPVPDQDAIREGLAVERVGLARLEDGEGRVEHGLQAWVDVDAAQLVPRDLATRGCGGDVVRNLLDVLVPNSQSALGDGWEAMAANLIAGYGAIPLVGTAEQIVDGMLAFSNAGLDGITLSWVNYEEGLTQFRDTLLPIMQQAGLRA